MKLTLPGSNSYECLVNRRNSLSKALYSTCQRVSISLVYSEVCFETYNELEVTRYLPTFWRLLSPNKGKVKISCETARISKSNWSPISNPRFVYLVSCLKQKIICMWLRRRAETTLKKGQGFFCLARTGRSRVIWKTFRRAQEFRPVLWLIGSGKNRNIMKFWIFQIHLCVCIKYKAAILTWYFL